MATVKKIKKYQNSGKPLKASSDNTRIPKRNPVAEQKASTRKTANSFFRSGLSNKRASDEWFNSHRDYVIRKGYDDIAEGLRQRSNEYDSTSKEDFRKADSARASMKKILPEKKKGGKVPVAKEGKWIQKAIKKPGALRKQLGAKPGQPIPAGKLAAAAKKPGKLGQRARLAQTLKKMKKK